MSKGVGLLKYDGTVCFADQNLCDMLQYSLDEITGIDMEEIVAPSDYIRYKNEFERVTSLESEHVLVNLCFLSRKRLPVMATFELLVSSFLYSSMCCYIFSITANNSSCTGQIQGKHAPISKPDGMDGSLGKQSILNLNSSHGNYQQKYFQFRNEMLTCC